MSRSRLMRTAAVVLGGGVLLQASGGCSAATFAPLVLSLLESILLSSLTGGTAVL